MKKLLLAFALCFSASSFAGVITDTVEQNVYVNYWNPVSYTHNLNDNTENFTIGSAISATIDISLSDDGGFFDGRERVRFTIEDLYYGQMSTVSYDYSADLGINALAGLNADGLLEVTVSSRRGDFYVGDSVLTVTTADVPEPSSMALLGLGLLGLGMSRRRATKA